MAGGELKAELGFGDHDGPLTVLALRGTDELSRPFRYELDFTAEDLDLESAPMSRVHLRIEDPDGQVRHLDAACESVAFVPVTADASETQMRFRAVLVPAGTLLLGLRKGFRIHQGKSVPEIVKTVWQDCGLDSAWLDVSALQGTYPSRDFCCQYDETEWDFIHAHTLIGQRILNAAPALRHVGVYGFRRETLFAFAGWPQGPLEQAERLEQLRALERGVRIKVFTGTCPFAGVDTPEQLAALEARGPRA